LNDDVIIIIQSNKPVSNILMLETGLFILEILVVICYYLPFLSYLRRPKNLLK